MSDVDYWNELHLECEKLKARVQELEIEKESYRAMLAILVHAWEHDDYDFELTHKAIKEARTLLGEQREKE